MARIEADIVTTVAIGMAGALLGGFLLQVAAGLLGMLGGLIGAVVGAIIVVWLWQKVKSGR